ncbi:hypothetical protein QQS21_005848 [Conoideocrella luteorostrata]|uniref:Uncharacterized protein n=1 Tax=Conoideocrella luteorostrata TaxID=1105319 RepID=A0AAJ0FU13_9HYPO|nr:hypothetical protein QQS21_005848 [Conoideocrella luteorostrata]
MLTADICQSAPEKERTVVASQQDVPQNVLAVGPSRSRTDSLLSALIELGYDHAYHEYDVALNPCGDKARWRLYEKKWHGRHGRSGDKEQHGRLAASDLDKVIGHCAAIKDFDAAVFAQDLISVYPDAKVVLNICRNREAWFKSCQTPVLKLEGSWLTWIRSFFCTERFWVQGNFLRCLWLAFCRGDFEHTGR